MEELDFLIENCSIKYALMGGMDSFVSPFQDITYSGFLQITDGGFFFENALHIYGLGQENTLHNQQYINDLIKAEYSDLLKRETIFFGCDIFGNQFTLSDEGIGFFNIETTEHELIAKSFSDFINVLKNDWDYYSGFSILSEWNHSNKRLSPDERLAAIMPFVMGGEYGIKNLYPLTLDKIIKYNASIARQIKDLPDGQSVNIKVTE